MDNKRKIVLWDKQAGDDLPPDYATSQAFETWLDDMVCLAKPKHRKNVKMIVGVGERDVDNFPRDIEQIYYVKD